MSGDAMVPDARQQQLQQGLRRPRPASSHASVTDRARQQPAYRMCLLLVSAVLLILIGPACQPALALAIPSASSNGTKRQAEPEHLQASLRQSLRAELKQVLPRESSVFEVTVVEESPHGGQPHALVSETTKQLSSDRWGHSTVFLPDENTVLFIGGKVSNGSAETLTNDVFALNISSIATNSTSGPQTPWQKLNTTGLPPIAFAADALVSAGDDDEVWLLGGITDDTINASAWAWRPNFASNSTWTSVRQSEGSARRVAGAHAIAVPTTTSPANSNREALASDELAFMMLGGVDASSERGDQALKLTPSHGTELWSIQRTNDDGPGNVDITSSAKLLDGTNSSTLPSIQYSTVTLTSGGSAPSSTDSPKTMLLGGLTASGAYAAWDNLWVYDEGTASWTQWATEGDIPPARQGHTSTVLTDGRIAVIGGVLEDGSVIKDVHLLNVSTEPAQWNKLSGTGAGGIDAGGIDAPARAYHSTLLVGDVLVVAFGSATGDPAKSSEHQQSKLSATATAPASSKAASASPASVYYLDTAGTNGWAWSDSIEGVLAARGVPGASASGAGKGSSQSAQVSQANSNTAASAKDAPSADASSTNPSPSTDSSSTAADQQSSNPDSSDNPASSSGSSLAAPGRSSASTSDSPDNESNGADGPEGSAASGVDSDAGQGTSSTPAESADSPDSSGSAAKSAGSSGSSGDASSAPKSDKDGTTGNAQTPAENSHSSQRAAIVASTLVGAAALAAVVGGLYAYRKRKRSQLPDAASVDAEKAGRNGAPPVSMLSLHNVKRRKTLTGAGPDAFASDRASMGPGLAGEGFFVKRDRTAFPGWGGINSDPFRDPPVAARSDGAAAGLTVAQPRPARHRSRKTYLKELDRTPLITPSSPFDKDAAYLLPSRGLKPDDPLSDGDSASHLSYSGLCAMHRRSLINLQDGTPRTASDSQESLFLATDTHNSPLDAGVSPREHLSRAMAGAGSSLMGRMTPANVHTPAADLWADDAPALGAVTAEDRAGDGVTGARMHTPTAPNGRSGPRGLLRVTNVDE